MPRNGEDDFGETLCDDPQSFINQRRGMFERNFQSYNKKATF